MENNPFARLSTPKAEKTGTTRGTVNTPQDTPTPPAKAKPAAAPAPVAKAKVEKPAPVAAKPVAKPAPSRPAAGPFKVLRAVTTGHKPAAPKSTAKPVNFKVNDVTGRGRHTSTSLQALALPGGDLLAGTGVPTKEEAVLVTPDARAVQRFDRDIREDQELRVELGEES